MAGTRERLPSGAARIAAKYPAIWAAYQQLGSTSAEAGPLNAHDVRLVKLALAIASQSEGAVHSHTRRALAEGVAPDALVHVALVAIPSIGLAKAVAAMTWIEDIVRKTEDSNVVQL